MLMPSIFGNDFMNDFFGGFPYKSNGTMQTDVSETDKGYKVTMNLPGYQKEDIKGEVKDGYLTVTATTSKNNDEKDKDGKYIRKERYSGSCSRSFYVGDAVTQDDVKAKFENGVLTLEVPKKEEAPKVEERSIFLLKANYSEGGQSRGCPLFLIIYRRRLQRMRMCHMCFAIACEKGRMKV